MTELFPAMEKFIFPRPFPVCIRDSYLEKLTRIRICLFGLAVQGVRGRGDGICTQFHFNNIYLNNVL